MRVRIELSLARLRSGNFSTLKAIGAGLLEMRMDLGPDYRIYLSREGDTLLLLLGGGTKKRQQDDIAAARNRLREHLFRKRQT